MRIVELDELPEGVRPQLAALKWLDGDAPQDMAFIRRLRRAEFPSSTYYGVYAIEGEEILGKVETLGLPFVTRAGRATVAGVSDVATRPDALGRGIARRLLDEVHRRERDAGRRWAFLWTRRSWGAHRLYERLRYRDVFTPPSALRGGRIRSDAGPDPRYRLARATPRDARLLERLLGVSTRGRLGFIPRFRGSFALKHRLGWRPLTRHVILRRQEEPVGYAFLQEEPASVGALEVVVRHRADAGPMVRALQRRAGRRWLSFGMTTFVSDHRPMLVRMGFACYPVNHAVLMARPLASGATLREPNGPIATCADAAYSSHRGDVF